MSAGPSRKTRKLAGLIGYPLGHSVSPAFQQAAFDYYRLPVEYQAWQTPSEDLATFFERFRTPDYVGLNVTIPHKQAVIPFLDSLDPMTAEIGAVNTIVKVEMTGEGDDSSSTSRTSLVGHNTDADGFLRALRERGGYEPGGKRVVILGAGGAARGIAFALLWAEAESIAIVNRTKSRADELLRSLNESRLKKGTEVELLTLAEDDPSMPELFERGDLVINATSVGMSRGSDPNAQDRLPVSPELLSERHFVADLVYNPAETALMREAGLRGARTLGGLAMLVFQGALAFELWTGERAPVGLMFARAEEALAALNRSGR